MSAHRRIIRIGAAPGRITTRGVSTWYGRPLVVIEEGERTIVRIDYTATLGPDDIIAGCSLASRGCKAALVFAERTADLYLAEARAWGNGYGHDYGLEQSDVAEVRARLTTGEAIVTRLHVRTPYQPADWRLRASPANPSVIDARSAAIYDDALAPTDLLAVGDGLFVDGQVYRMGGE